MHSTKTTADDLALAPSAGSEALTTVKASVPCVDMGQNLLVTSSPTSDQQRSMPLEHHVAAQLAESRPGPVILVHQPGHPFAHALIHPAVTAQGMLHPGLLHAQHQPAFRALAAPPSMAVAAAAAHNAAMFNALHTAAAGRAVLDAAAMGATVLPPGMLPPAPPPGHLPPPGLSQQPILVNPLMLAQLAAQHHTAQVQLAAHHHAAALHAAGLVPGPVSYPAHSSGSKRSRPHGADKATSRSTRGSDSDTDGARPRHRAGLAKLSKVHRGRAPPPPVITRRPGNPSGSERRPGPNNQWKGWAADMQSRALQQQGFPMVGALPPGVVPTGALPTPFHAGLPLALPHPGLPVPGPLLLAQGPGESCRVPQSEVPDLHAHEGLSSTDDEATTRQQQQQGQDSQPGSPAARVAHPGLELPVPRQRRSPRPTRPTPTDKLMACLSQSPASDSPAQVAAPSPAAPDEPDLPAPDMVTTPQPAGAPVELLDATLLLASLKPQEAVLTDLEPPAKKARADPAPVGKAVAGKLPAAAGGVPLKMEAGRAAGTMLGGQRGGGRRKAVPVRAAD